MMKKKRILVAMSGGVDSSVAALLLAQQGHDVEGVTMCLGVMPVEGGPTKCCGPQEVEDARQVCLKLGIRHIITDFAAELEDKVIAPFIAEYLRGRTPNPCVECNRSLKFDQLLKKAMAWGFDAMATGHYARIDDEGGTYSLKNAKDRKKDQTYFLHAIAKDALPYIIFPLADLTKDEVRSEARKAGLPISEKEESQDICFIPKNGFGDFLAGRSIIVEPGAIIHQNGKRLGMHRGIAHYTIGQRTGLGISWPVPLYVLAINATNNELIVGEKDLLKAAGLRADRVNLLVDKLPEEALVKIRYAHRGAKARISIQDGILQVDFHDAEEAVAPGQSAVLYDNGRILGGGVIKEVIFGHHRQNS
jgi:tRNA-specific 2-thiouridylase